MTLAVVMLLLILTNPHAPVLAMLLSARGRAVLRAALRHQEHSQTKQEFPAHGEKGEDG
jgi:hypothetical protein